MLKDYMKPRLSYSRKKSGGDSLVAPTLDFDLALLFGSELEAWWNPDDATKVTNTGGLCTQLLDSSANGHTLTTHSGGTGPTLSTLNGKTALTYSGAQSLKGTMNRSFSSGASCFMVGNQSSDSGTQRLMSLLVSGQTLDWQGTGSWLPLGFDGTTVFGTRKQDGWIGRNTLTTGTTYLYSSGSNGTIIYSRKNGSLPRTATFTPNATYSQVGLGTSAHSQTDCLRGQIGEAIIFNTELKRSHRQIVEGYLAHKFGIQTSLAADHPYRTNAPIMCPLPVDFSTDGIPSAATTITCRTPGVTMYYTMDGTTPTRRSTQYTGAIDTSLFSQRIKVLVTKNGFGDAIYSSKSYGAFSLLDVSLVCFLDASQRSTVLKSGDVPCGNGEAPTKWNSLVGSNYVNLLSTGHTYDHTNNRIRASTNYASKLSFQNIITDAVAVGFFCSGTGWLLGYHESGVETLLIRADPGFGTTANDGVSYSWTPGILANGTFYVNGTAYTGTSIYSVPLSSTPKTVISTREPNSEDFIQVGGLSQGDVAGRAGMDIHRVIVTNDIWSAEEIAYISAKLGMGV